MKTVAVKWEYEDELPPDISDEDYRAMFAFSKVDGVRMFAHIELNGERFYLKE